MANNDQTVTMEPEPYKLSEIFSIIPEFEGDQIFLGTFLTACDHAYDMAATGQRKFLIIHIRNKLRGRAAQLISSRNPATYEDIKQLLNLHFGDSRDLTSLIQDLQRIKQLPGETAISFYNRLQVLNAKMLANIQKSPLTPEQRLAQISLIETMALNTLLTGLEPKLGQLIRASQPTTLLQAQSRIKRETQLSYFENQKFQKPPSQIQPKQFQKKPQIPKCFSCQRLGHTSNQCRSQPQNQFPNTSNFIQRPTPTFIPRQNPNFTPRPNTTNNTTSQQPNGQNFSPRQTNFAPRFPNTQNQTPRPSVIQRNPNYQPRPIHYYSYPNEEDYYYAVNSNNEHYYSANSETYNQEDYYAVNSPENNQFYNPNSDESYYAANSNNEQENYYDYEYEYENPQNGNFLEIPIKDHPPESSHPTTETINNFQTNLDIQHNTVNLSNYPINQSKQKSLNQEQRFL